MMISRSRNVCRVQESIVSAMVRALLCVGINRLTRGLLMARECSVFPDQIEEKSARDGPKVEAKLICVPGNVRQSSPFKPNDISYENETALPACRHAESRPRRFHLRATWGSWWWHGRRLRRPEFW